MKIFGTVAEYNPFHFGHLHHISEMRKAGAEGIIAVMSGNFVQRANAAAADKFTRAKLAVQNGADLIIELPVSYSVASAEKFAEGAVFLLNATGCVDSICFGSECGDLEKLRQTADVLSDESFYKNIKRHLADGRSFASARASALEEKGIFAPDRPNDILAVEYLKAMRKTDSSATPVTVDRATEFTGATKIREYLLNKEYSKAFSAMPDNAAEALREALEKGLFPADTAYAERVILARLRDIDPKEISDCQGVTEGMENRIVAEAKKACSLEELYNAVKTKRYPMSTVKRAILCSYLDIKSSEARPPYIRVLAFNEIGREIMNSVKKNGTLPLLTKFSPELESNADLKPFITQELRAGDFYSLCTPSVCAANPDRTYKLGMTECGK